MPSNRWTAEVNRDGREVIMRPSHQSSLRRRPSRMQIARMMETRFSSQDSLAPSPIESIEGREGGSVLRRAGMLVRESLFRHKPRPSTADSIPSPRIVTIETMRTLTHQRSQSSIPFRTDRSTPSDPMTLHDKARRSIVLQALRQSPSPGPNGLSRTLSGSPIARGHIQRTIVGATATSLVRKGSKASIAFSASLQNTSTSPAGSPSRTISPSSGQVRMRTFDSSSMRSMPWQSITPNTSPVSRIIELEPVRQDPRQSLLIILSPPPLGKPLADMETRIELICRTIQAEHHEDHETAMRRLERNMASHIEMQLQSHPGILLSYLQLRIAPIFVRARRRLHLPPCEARLQQLFDLSHLAIESGIPSIRHVSLSPAPPNRTRRATVSAGSRGRASTVCGSRPIARSANKANTVALGDQGSEDWVEELGSAASIEHHRPPLGPPPRPSSRSDSLLNDHGTPAHGRRWQIGNPGMNGCCRCQDDEPMETSPTGSMKRFGMTERDLGASRKFLLSLQGVNP